MQYRLFYIELQILCAAVIKKPLIAMTLLSYKMPDISMCMGTGCPLRESCYRAIAKPDRMQTYFSEVPFTNDECPYYYEVKLQQKDI